MTSSTQVPSRNIGATLIVLQMWVAAFVILLGFETKLLSWEAQVLPLFAAFAALVFAYDQARRFVLSRYVVWTQGYRLGWLRLRKPTGAVERALRVLLDERASAERIELRYVERTWPVVNAYAIHHGGTGFIAVTGGVIGLAISPDPQKRMLARFILNHELAHILFRDTSAISLSAAIVQVMLLLFPLKLLALPWISFEKLGAAYAGIFPIVMERVQVPSIGPMNLPLFEIGPTVALLLAVAFYVAGLWFLSLQFTSLIHFRELHADSFARKAAGLEARDEISAVGALFRALPATIAAHSFLGSRRWHPPPVIRRLSLEHLRDGGIVRTIASVIVASTLAYQLIVVRGGAHVDSHFAAISFLAASQFVLVLEMLAFCWLLTTPRIDAGWEVRSVGLRSAALTICGPVIAMASLFVLLGRTHPTRDVLAFFGVSCASYFAGVSAVVACSGRQIAKDRLDPVTMNDVPFARLCMLTIGSYLILLILSVLCGLGVAIVVKI